MKSRLARFTAMRTLPESFETRLRQEFRSRIRARWSPKRGCVLLEQKDEETHTLDDREAEKLDASDDILIQARDGYSTLFEVWPGTLVPCRHCGADLKLPQPKKLCRLECETCKHSGKREAVTIAASYDFNDQLLEALRDLDYVDHSGLEPKERIRRMRERNLWMQETKERFLRAEKRYSVEHDWRAIASVEQTGYKPAPFWINPAESRPFLKRAVE